MKLNDVHVTNWTAPGAEYWRRVEASPDEPLIEATMHLTLSHREYRLMCERDKEARGQSTEQSE